MTTYAYEEWSKAYKIKEVKDLFTEYNKLKLCATTHKKNESDNLEKIRFL